MFLLIQRHRHAESLAITVSWESSLVQKGFRTIWVVLDLPLVIPVRVVDVEADGLEHCAQRLTCRRASVDAARALPAERNRALHDNLGAILVPDRLALAAVVEGNSDRGARDSRRAVLVYKLRLLLDPHAAQLRNAEHEADPVQNVALASPVTARDRVERCIERTDDCALRVRLEAVENDLVEYI